jgi:hypothetical protein
VFKLPLPGTVFKWPLPRERVYRSVAPGTCLISRCHGNVYVFLFLSSGNCSIVVVEFVAADACLPSSYVKTTVSSGSIIG